MGLIGGQNVEIQDVMRKEIKEYGIWGKWTGTGRNGRYSVRTRRLI